MQRDALHGRDRAAGSATRRGRKPPGRNTSPRCTARKPRTNRCGCRCWKPTRPSAPQQETVFQRRTQIQTDEQKCDFYRQGSRPVRTDRKTKPQLALAAVERTAEDPDPGNRRAEQSQGKLYSAVAVRRNFFARQGKPSWAVSRRRSARLQDDIERRKRSAHRCRQPDRLSQKRRRGERKTPGEIAAELGALPERIRPSDGLADGMRDERREETGQALNTCVEALRERTLESTMVTASIQSLSQARDEQAASHRRSQSQIQEHRRVCCLSKTSSATTKATKKACARSC